MNNKKQIQTIAIILVAVIALSVGFAAFSSTLNIESQASVNPNSDDFSVKFSKVEGTLDESNVIATNIVGEDVEAREAKIDNSNNPTITNLNASFTKPGESVTYEFYVMNTGEYNAYLRDVNFKTNNDKFISCTAGSGATPSLVEQACEGITFELTIGGQVYTKDGTFVVQELAKGTSKKVVVKISYASGSALADGPFTVNIGDVALTYASTSAGEYPIPEIPIEEEEVCFISTVPGELNYYICNDTDIIIPDELPVSTVTDMVFSMDKCLSYAKMIGIPEDEILSSCEHMEEEYNNIPLETKLEGDGESKLYLLGDVVYTNSQEVYPIKRILEEPFRENNLTSVVLPKYVEVIDEAAFTENLLTEIVIPAGVKNILGSTFGDNDLISVKINASKADVNIDESAFGWDSGSECNSWTGDIKDNPCIEWVNG